jgi:hypothetical protein
MVRPSVRAYSSEPPILSTNELLILEILTTTTLEVTQRVLAPLALLMMAGGLVWLGDRLTRRRLAG